MYSVLLAVKSKQILQELKELRIWGDVTGFEISEITSDFEQLTEKLKEERYHMLFLEASEDTHVLPIIRTIKKEKLCKAVAVVCQNPDFKTVRKSFLLGVDDYLASPFEISQFITLFSRIENKEHGKQAQEICKQEELLGYFEHSDPAIKDCLDKLLYAALSEYMDLSESLDYLKRIIGSVMNELFENNAWLSNFFEESDYIPEEEADSDYEELIQKSVDSFYDFFREFTELYPLHGDGVEEILLYILARPDGDLRQKTISEELHMNRSYMSMIFAAQSGLNFVDYINIVKMKRAAYLLKHTDLKIIDIAGTLDFKDMGYFLKKFKAKFGVTPSQYRIPETYDFQI